MTGQTYSKLYIRLENQIKLCKEIKETKLNYKKIRLYERGSRCIK